VTERTKELAMLSYAQNDAAIMVAVLKGILSNPRPLPYKVKRGRGQRRNRRLKNGPQCSYFFKASARAVFYTNLRQARKLGAESSSES